MKKTMILFMAIHLMASSKCPTSLRRYINILSSIEPVANAAFRLDARDVFDRLNVRPGSLADRHFTLFKLAVDLANTKLLVMDELKSKPLRFVLEGHAQYLDHLHHAFYQGLIYSPTYHQNDSFLKEMMETQSPIVKIRDAIQHLLKRKDIDPKMKCHELPRICQDLNEMIGRSAAFGTELFVAMSFDGPVRLNPFLTFSGQQLNPQEVKQSARHGITEIDVISPKDKALIEVKYTYRPLTTQSANFEQLFSHTVQMFKVISHVHLKSTFKTPLDDFKVERRILYFISPITDEVKEKFEQEGIEVINLYNY